MSGAGGGRDRTTGPGPWTDAPTSGGACLWIAWEHALLLCRQGHKASGPPRDPGPDSCPCVSCLRAVAVLHVALQDQVYKDVMACEDLTQLGGHVGPYPHAHKGGATRIGAGAVACRARQRHTGGRCRPLHTHCRKMAGWCLAVNGCNRGWALSALGFQLNWCAAGRGSLHFCTLLLGCHTCCIPALFTCACQDWPLCPAPPAAYHNDILVGAIGARAERQVRGAGTHPWRQNHDLTVRFA